MTQPILNVVEADRTAALNELDRLAFEESQLEFTQKFFEVREGAPFITSRHHETMARILDQVLRGEITRLIIRRKCV